MERVVEKFERLLVSERERREADVFVVFASARTLNDEHVCSSKVVESAAEGTSGHKQASLHDLRVFLHARCVRALLRFKGFRVQLKEVGTAGTWNELCSLLHCEHERDEEKDGVLAPFNVHDGNTSTMAHHSAELTNQEGIATHSGCASPAYVVTAQRPLSEILNSCVEIRVGSVHSSASHNVACTYVQQRVDTLASTSRSRGRASSDEIYRLALATLTFELLAKRTHECVRVAESQRTPSGLPHLADRGLFVMYNYCRIESILTRCTMEGNGGDARETSTLVAEEGGELLAALERLCGVVAAMHGDGVPESSHVRATSVFAVDKLCRCAIDLAMCFSRFYSKRRVLADVSLDHLVPMMRARVELISWVKRAFELVFELLGIDAVKEM